MAATRDIQGVINVKIDAGRLDEVTRLLADIKGGVPKALVGAINDTSRHMVTSISKAIRNRVNIKKRDIDKRIDRRMATPNFMFGRITLSESKRLGLKYFGAKQPKASKRRRAKMTGEQLDRLTGVTYQISKFGGMKFIPGAFIGTKRLGEHVFKRIGKSRKPIIKLQGPSPWGVFVMAGLRKKAFSESQALLEKNLDRRVNFLILKHSGAIK